MYNFSYNSSSQSVSGLFDSPSSDFSEILLEANQHVTMEQLQNIAQPKAMYRERYSSETDETRNRQPRFIRAEDGHPEQLQYPTVEVR